jgi:hypothetical protein
MQEIDEMARADQIPVAMALTAEEKETATYQCIMARVPQNLNALGWKVCHIDKVSLGHRGRLETCNLGTIVDRFRRFLSPSNMFVVPKAWAGLGELPEVVEVARRLVVGSPRQDAGRGPY